ncbi:TetR family transcriptional regulator [Amycolatopsis sp. SID8362]|uniref:TetR/AcrR family transcriptional regulator n=1 Tax=Amycolatopsis sp. SID8362 TaxID=2690346 RepID=UPI00136F19CE|nr:TetR family transcriptional regulator [Amycolatopsis sp. SID8362]NBH06857.1 TetR family transcriptional regulator [Amycolatopsis sp. SID8362]NED43554.1 TetR/AcrR family transcriptional regulator [Amycolatopsis sp. SID8362]
MTGTTENQQTARRSDATRATILAAARERFAADGYEKATIRAIARDAKIDPSMVMRYYGSKADLFTAAVSIDPGLPGLPLEPREAIGRTLVSRFLTLWEENEEFTALMRVGATYPAAADRMQSVLRDQLIPLARLVGPEPEQAPARAALCASTVLGLALTRYVLRFPASMALSREEIVDWLGPTLQRYLTAPTP